MAQQVGTSALVLAAWAAAGLLSLAGALTYAELGALFPQAGGDYLYLREAYGEAPAFLYGWTFFVVGAGGGIAALSTAFSTFLSALLPVNDVWGRARSTFSAPPRTGSSGRAKSPPPSSFRPSIACAWLSAGACRRPSRL